MTQQVLGPKGSPRRRWTLLLPFVAALALGLFYIAGAQAVHQETFELDGNVVVDAGGSQDLDWASFFNASGGEEGVGRAVNDNAVISITTFVVLNYFLTVLLFGAMG